MSQRPINWLRTINALYDYTAAHPLSPRGAAMYHYILYTFSRARWPEWVTIGLASLAAGCNMSVSAAKRARGELVDLGLIDYAAQGANRHAQYRLRTPDLWFADISTEEAEAVHREAVASLKREPVYDMAAYDRGG